MDQFTSYMTLYGKTYKTKEEFEFRLSIFQEKLKFIKNFEGHEVGLNHMSDWSHEEYEKLLAFKMPK